MNISTTKFGMGRRNVLALGAITLATTTGKATSTAAADSPPSALEAMQRDDRFSKWLELISYTGLGRYMTGDGGRTVPFTMFAPTNKAIAPYPDLINELHLNTPFADTFRVTKFIRSYTLPGLHPLSEFAGKTVQLHGFEGNPVKLDGRDPKSLQLILLVGAKKSVNIIDRDPIIASNAIVYALDSVDLRMVYAW
jgi:uncharacterized surface protein with fasciclin (FAS1) repeats